MLDFYIRKKEDLIEAIEEYGFIPFFKNSIEGFSIEERIDQRVWFPDEGEGIWEWKGPVIRESGCAYGKFFKNKAVFIDKKFFPDFANFRRDGYDFDARADEGIADYREQTLYNLIDNNAPVLSKRLKEIGGYKKEGVKGFDGLINGLQHKCYVLIDDFVYAVDKKGKPYGWGIAKYSTPERFLGKAFTDNVYKKDPKESFTCVLAHLQKILPKAKTGQIERLLGYVEK